MKNNIIVKNIDYYKKRQKPEKLIKYKIVPQGINHLSNVKKERDYYYYTCDYCGEEIKLLKNEKSIDGNTIASGGLVRIPQTLSKQDSTFYLALCMKCLNSVVQQFEQRKMENDNYNHIPRID